jgi:hypothetical protein
MYFRGLTCCFVVELPGIEPVSGCWSVSRTGTELLNDIDCDSPQLTSFDTECAQNVPTQSRPTAHNCARLERGITRHAT